MYQLQNPPKLWLAYKFWILPWFCPLMVANTQHHPMITCQVFTPFFFLIGTSHRLACWSLCHACKFILAFLKVFLVCMSCFHSVDIGQTHTQSCKYYHISFITIIQRHILTIALVALNLWVISLSTYLSCWFGVSCHRVVLSVWSHCHDSQVHFLLHLVILLKICRLENPPSNRPRSQWPCTAAQNYAELEVVLWEAYIAQFRKWTNWLSPRNVQEMSHNPIQSTLLARSPINSLVGQLEKMTWAMT